MSTGNSEQQDRQKGSEEPMASNSASSNVNHGIEAGQVTVQGSVTINHYHGIQSPQRQNHDSPASSSNTQAPSQRTDMNSPDAVQNTPTASTVGVSNPQSSSKNNETLPSFIRSSTPMPLTDNDWSVIDDLFTRIPNLKEDSRDAIVIEIAKTPEQANQLAKIANILGQKEFYVALTNVIRTSKDEGMEERTLRSLKNYVLNAQDNAVLKKLIFDRFENPANQSAKLSPNSHVGGAQGASHPSIRKTSELRQQCQTLFIAEDWDSLLDLLDQKTNQMGWTQRAKSLRESVVIFKADYESIRNRTRDGLVTVDEEKRMRATLWSRVVMLIDDIDGNLKF